MIEDSATVFTLGVLDVFEIPFKTIKRHTSGRTYHVVVDECLERRSIQGIRALGKRRSEVSRARRKTPRRRSRPPAPAERSCARCTRQEVWGCDACKVVDERGEERWFGPARIPLRIDDE